MLSDISFITAYLLYTFAANAIYWAVKRMYWSYVLVALSFMSGATCGIWELDSPSPLDLAPGGGHIHSRPPPPVATPLSAAFLSGEVHAKETLQRGVSLRESADPSAQFAHLAVQVSYNQS